MLKTLNWFQRTFVLEVILAKNISSHGYINYLSYLCLIYITLYLIVLLINISLITINFKLSKNSIIYYPSFYPIYL